MNLTRIRRIAGPLIGILISLGFLALALYQVKLNEVAAALASANYWLVALAAVFTMCSYALRSARWARLLLPEKRIPVARLFPVLIVGFALNNLLPARPGEFARAISLGQREGLSKTLGLATIVVERVADGLTLIGILALLSLAFELPGWGQQAEVVSLGIFAIALAALLFLLWREALASRLFELIVRRLPARFGGQLTRMFRSFILGLRSLRSPTDILAVTLYSLAIWLCEGAHYFAILSAFGLLGGLRLHLLGSGFTLVVVNLSVAIPAAPGGVGPFEWAGSLALGAFGVEAGRALSAVLVAHMIQYVVVTGLGILFTAREGYKLTQAVERVEGDLS